MTYTELRFRAEARTKLLAGAAALVRTTLGPESRSVLIEKKWGSPLVCDDGVTIAKAVKLTDCLSWRQLFCAQAERLQAGSYPCSGETLTLLHCRNLPHGLCRTAAQSYTSASGSVASSS